MDLFEHASQQQPTHSPLAAKIRPRKLDEIVGQDHILGKGKLLHRAIEADELSSIVLYGPPGTGKTTIAKVIANTTEASFQQLNAVTSGVADIKEVTKNAKDNKLMYGHRTVLFIDEIHRFNKSQQDALLPFVEDGTVILIGATTENPMFELNSALVSRSRIFRLEALTHEDIRNILLRAAEDKERGLGSFHLEIDHEALDHLIHVAGGDARSALNALELAAQTTEPDENGRRPITLQTAEESIQEKVVQYDKTGDNHYDTISAFIKSLRGSDPDAALYYLAKMLYAGEDPRFIARRMVVHASEDVGMADPRALQIATAAADALEFVGLPEARIPMAQAAVYIATAPKSNAIVRGINEAMEAVSREERATVPAHLQDTHGKGAKQLGRGIGYKYPHDYPNGYIEQQYLPDEHRDKTFYHPTPHGYERKINDHLDQLKKEDQRL